MTLLSGLVGALDFLMLAEGEAAPAAGDGKVAAPSPILQYLPFLAIGVFFYFMLIRPQQREQRKRQDLLSALKKNDRVVAAGGIIGTIADISSDGSRVTLRVDDTTRIKVLRSSVQGLFEEPSDT